MQSLKAVIMKKMQKILFFNPVCTYCLIKQIENCYFKRSTSLKNYRKKGEWI